MENDGWGRAELWILAPGAESWAKGAGALVTWLLTANLKGQSTMSSLIDVVLCPCYCGPSKHGALDRGPCFPDTSILCHSHVGTPVPVSMAVCCQGHCSSSRDRLPQDLEAALLTSVSPTGHRTWVLGLRSLGGNKLARSLRAPWVPSPVVTPVKQSTVSLHGHFWACCSWAGAAAAVTLGTQCHLAKKHQHN